MKRILILMAFAMAFVSQKADAQVFPLYGTTVDTLTNVDSVAYVIDLRNANAISVVGELLLVRTSGTGTITVRTYTQNFNKEALAWVHTATSVVGTTATTALVNYLNSSNPGRYVRFVVSQTGTAVTRPRFAYATRLQ